MASSETAPSPKGRRIPDEDFDAAKTRVAEAFQLAGLVGPNGLPVCPACGEHRKGKVVIRQRYWKCHRCDTYPGQDGYLSPLRLLTELHGWSYPDAVDALLGRPVTGERREVAERAKKTVLRTEPEFTATVDPEVYLWLARQGSRDGAAAYYGRWHIDPRAVAELGCVLLPTTEWDATKALREKALTEFGVERLTACGVARTDEDDGKLRWPGIASGYAAMEPHVDANGDIRYYQLRAAGKKEQAVRAHKQAKAARAAAQAAGETFTGTVPEYVPPFLSLRGATAEMMIGGGVWRLSRLRRPTTIVIVEGIKDAAAARTMGAEAYAIPGAKTLPPPDVVELLRRHRVRVALDNDEAGQEGRDIVIAYLKEHGVEDVEAHDLPDGKDVTDILVDRHSPAASAAAA